MPGQQGEILNLVRTSKFLEILSTFLARFSMASQITDLRDVIGDSALLLGKLVQLFPSEVTKVVMAHAFLNMAQAQAINRGGGS
jgi:hypothetical protein